jgi:hypothetical protein
MRSTVSIEPASTDPSLAEPLLGDPMPPALASYYEDLDAGRAAAAATWFTETACYAVPGPGLETQPRLVTLGTEALRQRFDARGHLDRRHAVRLCTVEARHALVEGVVTDGSGAPVATFVASATMAPDGRIERYLAYGCEGAREPFRHDVEGSPAEVREVLDRYFHALDAGRFDEAAACFSPDVLYSHPPYRHTGLDGDHRVEFRGREALLAAFQARGRQRFGHAILICVQRGAYALLEGAVHDLPHGGSGSFISSVSLDAAGLIQRYVSFYCEPSVDWVSSSGVSA